MNELDTTLKLHIGKKVYLMNGGGLLIIYSTPPSVKYKTHQLAKLIIKSKDNPPAALEIFLTSPSDVRISPTIFQINPVVGKWPDPPPVGDNSRAQIRIESPGHPNAPPGNTYASGNISQLSVNPISGESNKYIASGYVSAQGIGTFAEGAFCVYAMYE